MVEFNPDAAKSAVITETVTREVQGGNKTTSSGVLWTNNYDSCIWNPQMPFGTNSTYRTPTFTETLKAAEKPSLWEPLSFGKTTQSQPRTSCVFPWEC